MKKLVVNLMLGLTLLGMFGLSGKAFASETYYGNGVYCNSHTCHVDWSEARHSIGSIIYHGWINGIGDILGGVSRWGK